MPPSRIRQLRDLMRYRSKLKQMASGEKNRLQNCLTVSNIQLSNVVSDTFGKSAQHIIDRLIENPHNRSFDISPLIHISMKGKLPQMKLATDGLITPSMAEKIRIIKKHHADLQSRINELEIEILGISSPYQKQLDLLLTAPSVRSIFTAIGIISKVGINMNAFPSSKHLCSWAGLTPGNDNSAGRKKTACISKGGSYLKSLLVQCATGVIRNQRHQEFRHHYLDIKQRCGHKRAIIAVARMLLTAFCHMLKKNEHYNVPFYKKRNHSFDFLPLEHEITIEQAVTMAQLRGYAIKSAHP